jgi:NAD+ synthase (glutamine-hydrolysing)
MQQLRVMVAQVQPRKGAYAENLRRVGGVLAQATALEKPPQLLVFPETALTGYFIEGGVRELALPAGTLFRDLAAQHAMAAAPPIDVVVGFYEEYRNRYYNAAMYARLGGPDAGIVHVHRKIFLPTYGLFDEERFVEHGHTVHAFATPWGRMALGVCEDAWHTIVPTLAALDGAQAFIVPSASPARGVAPDEECGDDEQRRPSSVRRWEILARQIAAEHGMYVVFAQLVGFEGGKGLQGSSVVADPHGEILVRGPLFEEALMAVTFEQDEITRARFEQPLLADLETQFLNLLDARRTAPPPPPGTPDLQAPPAGADRPSATSYPLVQPETDRDPMDIDASLVERWLVAFLRDEVVRRRGFAKGVVGLSGGVDSSVTAALAVRALGREHVIGVRMPYRTSSAESLAHAELLAEQLGLELLTVDISAAVDGYLAAADPDADATRRGNVMARMRMITLFDLSARHRALPLGTGNKTERLMGYFTWHADDSPPVNPLGDLFKTQVIALARHLGVPEAIVQKPATADLVQGQTDEADLGISYARADRILHWLLRGLTAEQIGARGFERNEIDLVARRLHATHWKRRLPTVAMVSSTAIGESYLRPVDY